MQHDPAAYFAAMMTSCAHDGVIVTEDNRLRELPVLGVRAIDYLHSIVALSIALRVTIPATLMGERALTIREFVEKAIALPKSDDPLFVLHQLRDLAETYTHYFWTPRADRG